MLVTRVLAAMVFAPALLYAVYLGGITLRVVCALVSLVMLWEALRLLVPEHTHKLLHGVAWLCGCLVLASSLNFGPMPLGMLLLPTMTLGLMLAALACPGDLATAVQGAAGALLAVGYTMGLMPLLWHLRERPGLGLGLALSALFCTWASDTGAYFAGRAFGRCKLYPRISPGKTLEGAAGGLAAAMAMALALRSVLHLGLTAPQALTLGLIAATLGILGDLSESLLKRQAGVKDSSQLIPGHGGFLDRFDGVLFALYGVEAYTTWVLGL